MLDKPADVMWVENPMDTNDNTKKKQKRLTTKERSLSRWFVSNQKTEEWDEKKLNQLHIVIILLLVLMYICHVISSPFIKFINNQTAIIIINLLESFCLIVAIVCLIKMCYVNGSRTAAKLIAGKVRTYIYGFWILRSFIIELLKGQIVYSFVHVFHSVLIYSTDMWYLSNRKTLIFNLLLLLSIITYEFFISISPFGPNEPSWMFMNIKTTANSLSRSSQFNLFVIFFDALLVAIYDSKRSKYIMVVKKQKRDILAISLERIEKLNILWKGFACSCFTGFIVFILESSSKLISQISPLLYKMLLGSICLFFTLFYAVILYHSSNKSSKIIRSLLQERKVIFILILLGVLFYIDNLWDVFTANGTVFPIVIVCFISFDFIGGYFPRKLSIIMMSIIVATLLWNIFNYTFLEKDCEEKKLHWGIFGKKISHCTIRRLIYQSILSLLVSAAIRTFTGRTDNLFFCNANVYRSTGTIQRSTTSATYVRSMMVEQRSFSRKDKNAYQQGDDVDDNM